MVPTVTPAVPFTDGEDAQALRASMKGLGTDEMAIINVLAHRTSYQRQIIKDTYNTTLERDLVDDLKSELGNKFEDVMVALMTPMPQYLAKFLKKAISGNDLNTIIEILCTRDKPSIEHIKSFYMEENGTELTVALETLPCVKIREFLIAKITEECSLVSDDLQIAKYLQQKLFDAVEGKIDGLVEDEMLEMMTKFSHPMLRLVFREYFNIHDNEFINIIETKFPEELRDTMRTIYQSITSPPEFFSKALNSAIAGTGTDDPKLIRLVVSRCEIDMGNIKEEYEKLYKESLEKAIKGDTSGDYRKALLALIESPE